MRIESMNWKSPREGGDRSRVSAVVGRTWETTMNPSAHTAVRWTSGSVWSTWFTSTYCCGRSAPAPADARGRDHRRRWRVGPVGRRTAPGRGAALRRRRPGAAMLRTRRPADLDGRGPRRGPRQSARLRPAPRRIADRSAGPGRRVPRGRARGDGERRRAARDGAGRRPRRPRARRVRRRAGQHRRRSRERLGIRTGARAPVALRCCRPGPGPRAECVDVALYCCTWFRVVLLNRPGIRIPDSRMAQHATDLVRKVATPLVYDHSRRVFLFGSLRGQEQGLDSIPTPVYRSDVPRPRTHGEVPPDGPALRDRRRRRGPPFSRAATASTARRRTGYGRPSLCTPPRRSRCIWRLRSRWSPAASNSTSWASATTRSPTTSARRRGGAPAPGLQEPDPGRFHRGHQDRPETTFGNVKADVLAHFVPGFQRRDFVETIRNPLGRSDVRDGPPSPASGRGTPASTTAARTPSARRHHRPRPPSAEYQEDRQPVAVVCVHQRKEQDEVEEQVHCHHIAEDLR